MHLFYQRTAEKENETYVPIVDSPSDLQQITKSIKDYAVNGNRLLISAQAFDEIELVEAILTACGFVEKSFITAIVDFLYKTRSNSEELENDCEIYKSCMADYESTIEELLEKMKGKEEINKCKRTLWISRAEMARGIAEMCEKQFDCCEVSRSRHLVGWDKKQMPKRMTTTEWGQLWRKIEQLCRKKAAEYGG